MLVKTVAIIVLVCFTLPNVVGMAGGELYSADMLVLAY